MSDRLRTKLPERLFRSLFAVMASAAAATFAAEPLATKEIAPGMYVHQGTFALRSAENLGDNANIGFIVGEKCVAVIDTGGSHKLGERLRASVKAATDKPICYVINTHVHPDHIFGNTAFKQDNAPFVGHTLLRESMAARGRVYLNSLKRDLGDAAEGSDLVPPDITIDSSKDVDLGNRVLKLRAWQRGHSETDISVYDVNSKTLWVSDLLFVTHIPALDGSISGWLAVMKELRAMDIAQVVPGHGAVPAPWPAALDAQQRYLQLVMDETRAALRNKRAMQEATEEVGYSEQPRWENWDDFHRRNVIGAYKELEWED